MAPPRQAPLSGGNGGGTHSHAWVGSNITMMAPAPRSPWQQGCSGHSASGLVGCPDAPQERHAELYYMGGGGLGASDLSQAQV